MAPIDAPARTLTMHPILHRALTLYDVDLHLLEKQIPWNFASKAYPREVSRKVVNCIPYSFPPILGQKTGSSLLADRMYLNVRFPAFFTSTQTGIARVTARLPLKSDELKFARSREITDYVPDPLLAGYKIHSAVTSSANSDDVIFTLATQSVDIIIPPEPKQVTKVSQPALVGTMSFGERSAHHPADLLTKHFGQTPSNEVDHQFTSHLTSYATSVPGSNFVDRYLRFHSRWYSSEENRQLREIPGVLKLHDSSDWIFLEGRVDLQQIAAVLSRHNHQVNVTHDGMTQRMTSEWELRHKGLWIDREETSNAEAISITSADIRTSEGASDSNPALSVDSRRDSTMLPHSSSDVIAVSLEAFDTADDDQVVSIEPFLVDESELNYASEDVVELVNDIPTDDFEDLLDSDLIRVDPDDDDLLNPTRCQPDDLLDRSSVTSDMRWKLESMLRRPTKAKPVDMSLTDQLAEIAAEASAKALNTLIAAPAPTANQVWPFFRFASDTLRDLQEMPQPLTDLVAATKLQVSTDALWALFKKLDGARDRDTAGGLEF